EELHGLHPCHGSEGIVEVDSLLLHETSCHQASLVLDDGASLIPLQLEHPLKGDRAVTAREVSSQVRFFSTASISDCIAARHAACPSASAKDRGSPSSHARCNCASRS